MKGPLDIDTYALFRKMVRTSPEPSMKEMLDHEWTRRRCACGSHFEAHQTNARRQCLWCEGTL